jgi:ABC-2 type transport system ATP-binding protein
MDEAERCHRLAFIAAGRLLTTGTAREVVRQAGLSTWSVEGPDLPKLAESLRGRAGVDQAVPFGGTLHVSGADPEALSRAVEPFRQEPYRWQAVDSSLEDVFIHLMGRSEAPPV